jgi:sulfur carrier protein
MNVLVNGTPRTLPERTTIRRLLDELKLPTRGIAVEVNQQIVPRDQHANRALADGDRLEIVSIVGGG